MKDPVTPQTLRYILPSEILMLAFQSINQSIESNLVFVKRRLNKVLRGASFE